MNEAENRLQFISFLCEMTEKYLMDKEEADEQEKAVS